MKKILSFVVMITLTTTLSCGGGSGSGGSGGTDSGDHFLQAKQIATAAVYAAIISHLGATQGVLIDGFNQYGTSWPASDTGSYPNSETPEIDYSYASRSSSDEGDLTGSYAFTSQTVGTTGTVTISSLTWTGNPNTIGTPPFTIDSTTYSDITIGSAETEVTGSATGSVTATIEAEPEYQSVSINGSNIDSEDMLVTLEDTTTGTVTFTNWTVTSTYPVSELMSNTTTASTATVTYDSEIYNCQNVSGTFTSPISSESSESVTFTPNANMTCSCTNC